MSELPENDRGVVRLEEISPAEYNPRRISPLALDGLGESMKRWGVVQDIVVNRRSEEHGWPSTSTPTIVGGHQRYAALEMSGVEQTPVVWVDLDEKEEKALNLALNNPFIAGEFDNRLDDLIAELQDGFDIDALSELRFDELRSFVPPPTTVPTNADDEWEGMPEFVQEDQTAYRSLKVNFPDAEAFDKFCTLVNQDITDKVRSIWFPEIEIDSFAKREWTDDGDEE